MSVFEFIGVSPSSMEMVVAHAHKFRRSLFEFEGTLLTDRTSLIVVHLYRITNRPVRNIYLSRSLASCDVRGERWVDPLSVRIPFVPKKGKG